MNVIVRPPAYQGFVLPCAPVELGRAPSGPRWQHEIKHDGYRIIARKDRGDVRLWTRQKNERGGSFTRITEAMRRLPVTSCTIDGEAIVERSDGHSDFYALKSTTGAARAVLMAFDLIELDGINLRKESIEERRARLERLCGGIDLIFSIAVDGEGPEVFRQACALGLEGIVSKTRGSIYQSGKSYNWVKTLNRVYRR